MALLFYLNEHINQSIKEGDDYLMSNKVDKFILPDGTEVDLAGAVKKCLRDTNFSPDEYSQALEVVE